MLLDLVFEGGGVRGVAFIGALEALADNGHQIGRVMGTSVGGLTAALLAVGYDVHAIRDKMLDQETGQLTFAAKLQVQHPPFSREKVAGSATRELLREVDFSFFPNMFENSMDSLLAQGLMRQDKLHPVFSVLEYMSVSDGDVWLYWIGETVNEHAGGEDWASMGLAELYQKTGRSLTVIASDISNPSMLVLNHSTAPNLPLKWAVRMTTSVPILFPPVIWQREWGLYRNRRIEGHYIVDGGLLSQFPIELFLSTQKETEVMMGRPTADSSVIGLLLDETKMVPGVRPTASPWAERIDELPGLKLMRLLLETFMTSSSASTAEVVQSHVVRLPTMGVAPFGFDIEEEQITAVINNAYNVVQDFLLGWQKDSRLLLTGFQQQYVQIRAETLVMGDSYSIENVSHSSVAVGEGARADMDVERFAKSRLRFGKSLYKNGGYDDI